MELSELVIVYFTCGAPLAMSRLFRPARRVSASDIAWSAAFLLLWPGVLLLNAIRVVHRRFVSAFDLTKFRLSDSETELSDHIVIRELCRQLTSLSHSVSYRELAEVAERYIGLRLLAHESPWVNGAGEIPELVSAAGHPMPTIAAVCHGRRNKRLAQGHLNRTREELFRLISSILESAGERETRAVIASELVLKIDPSLAVRLSQLIKDKNDVVHSIAAGSRSEVII